METLRSTQAGTWYELTLCLSSTTQASSQMVPLESLEKLGRIDVTCRPCYRSRKQEPDAIPEAFTTTARIEEAQPDIAVPLAKRKVAPPTSRAISRPPKVAHTFSEYSTDMSKPPLAVVCIMVSDFAWLLSCTQLTLHYRPARLLRYYGLVGLYTPDVTWPTWVREQQLSRVPGLAAPPTPVVAPRARTPAAFTRPAVAETQPLVRVDVVATKPALRKHAESNGARTAIARTRCLVSLGAQLSFFRRSRQTSTPSSRSSYGTPLSTPNSPTSVSRSSALRRTLVTTTPWLRRRVGLRRRCT